MIKEFFIDNIDVSNENILEQILRIEYIEDCNPVFIKKVNKKGFSMKWHLDDCYIYKHSKPPKHGNFNFIQIDKKKYFTFIKRPKYTAIVYMSDYNIDFTGGILEFSNGTKIIPNKNKVVLFDCNQLHRVSTILSGERQLLLIKLY